VTALSSTETGLQRPASLLRACLLLAAALAAPFPCFAGYGFWTRGGSGILAALTALGICLFAGNSALVVTAVSQRMNQGVQGVFGAMLVRMSVPLAALLVLPKIGGPLIAAGLMGMLMVYYLITLAVETWLSLRFVPASKNSGAKSPAAKVA
jgi:hypothetical protein